MWQVKARVDPFDANDPDFWIKVEHLGRYLFAADFLKRHFGKAATVIDAGCGTGYGTRELIANARRVIGMDADARTIQTTQSEARTPSPEFIRFDITHPLAPLLSAHTIDPPDLIVAFEVLEHLMDPERAIAEFFTTLTEGGYLLCSVPNARFEATDSKGSPRNPFHLHLFTLADIKTMLQRHGFMVTSVWGQATTNRLMHREIRLRRKHRLPISSSHLKVLHQEDSLRYFARMFAMPEPDDLADSYVFLVVARKTYTPCDPD